MAPSSSPPPEPPPSVWARIWADIRAAGWREAVLRYASHLFVLLLMFVALRAERLTAADFGRLELPLTAAQTEADGAALAGQAVLVAGLVDTAPSFGPLAAPAAGALTRSVLPRTLIPTRGRSDVITYTVQSGDTLFGLAERFNLQPETVLWGNYFTLKDDPHLLRPGQQLNILPVDGTYHYVTAGNTLEQIAAFYGVTPDAILGWAGNRLDPAQPALQPDTYVVVPGGRRESQAWVLPSLPRTARVRAGASSFGQCAGGYTGILGTGTFVWPTQAQTLSGFDYTTIHRGIDIRAGTGAPVAAVDHGVVMYAGWNEWGYGNLVVVDHGNGWESVYAHLSQWNVSCGQSVNQGEGLGLAGATGRATGPHLHFELRYNGAFVNPWDVLP
ncbi:MAG: peptidoglycan DD-metalloendopeptidase family protein [Anaerolineales bacterium]|nr:peptidoglycan DD-metalloendopeptidase family protein [Anaerolineales bacterium]